MLEDFQYIDDDELHTCYLCNKIISSHYKYTIKNKDGKISHIFCSQDCERTIVSAIIKLFGSAEGYLKGMLE